jgi:hypothetical protein
LFSTNAQGNTDINTEEFHISDPIVYAVKTSDPDVPCFNEAVSVKFSEQYVEAMKKDISALIH